MTEGTVTVIYKYPLGVPMGGATELMLPKGAVVLKVGCQGARYMIWMLVDTEVDEDRRRDFAIIGTGAQVPERATYLDTIFDGPHVWHVFELA